MDQHTRAYKKWRYNKLWRILNPQRIAFSKALRAMTREGRAKTAQANRRRTSRVQATRNDLTAQEWADILAEQQHKCAYCGREFSDQLPSTQDHRWPPADG